MKKKLFVMLIALLLCAGLLGTTAFAADTTLDLSKVDNSTGTTWSFEGVKLTLHSGSFALTGSNHNIMHLIVEAGATVESTSETVSVYHIENKGTISGGTFSSSNSSWNYGTITDGTWYVAQEVRNEGTISGGTFSDSGNDKLLNNVNSGIISGGTFDCRVYNNASITGGTFNGKVQVDENGTFSNVSPANIEYVLKYNINDSGRGSKYAAPGTPLSYTAEPPTGKLFSHWEAKGLTGVDTTQPAISFDMPANFVEIKAVFKDIVNYDLWVGGQQLTSQYPYLYNDGTLASTAPASGGYAYYDGNGTLTLNNYSYSGEGYGAYNNSQFYLIYSQNIALSIQLSGTSTLHHTNTSGTYGVAATGTQLVVKGPGTLVVSADDTRTPSSDSLKVENCTVKLVGGVGIGGNNGSGVVLNNCTFDAPNGFTDESLTITNSTVNLPGDNFDMPTTITNSTVVGGQFSYTLSVTNSYVTFSDSGSVAGAGYPVTLTNAKAWGSANQDGTNLEDYNDLKGADYKYMKILPCNSVTVTAESGGTARANVTEACADDTVTLTATPNTGYRFVEWQSDDVTVTDGWFAMPWKAVAVKAVFEKIYTVTYVADGKTIDTQTVAEGGDAVAPTVPTKTGHTGVWDKDGKNITVNTTITAVYIPIPYTVAYMADGVEVSKQTVDYGKDAVVPAVPTKVGYTGVWDKDGKCITGDTTITAVYTINTYTVTYLASGATIDTQTVEHGKDAAAPAIPAKLGHGKTVPYWDKDGKNITANTTITVVYTPDTYTITYMDGSKLLKTESYTYGVGVAAGGLYTPGKTGYSFAGWYAEKELKTKVAGVSDTTMEDITLYAKWTANDYDVEFNVNGGTSSHRNITVTYGEAYGTLPTAKHSTKYFAGWYTAKTGGTKVDKNTTVTTAADHTLYARWSSVPVTGDDNSVAQIAALCGALALSLTAVGVLMYKKRRS